ncbi:MAG: response regulator [Verrucomicrobia bacterium]|nr:response regulator [Verrucomicrobiota bacterium]
MKKLLIIEDDPIVANLYRGVFEKNGFKVETCASGQDGFFKIHEHHPDIVLLDLMLPVINGVEILKKIRAQKSFEKLPIVVFTNAYLPDMVQDALKAGAQQVFNKATVNPRELVEAISNVIAAGVQPRPDDAGKPGSTPAPAPVSSQTSFIQKLPIGKDDPRTFPEVAPELVNNLRQSLQSLVKTDDETTRVNQLDDIYRRVHGLTGAAAVAGLRSLAQLSSALEALLKELHDKPKSINSSTLRTLANSMDFLGAMATADNTPVDVKPVSVLVVDDEFISRKALVLALERAGLRPISVPDAHLANALIHDNQFDLVILDVDMPELNGYDLCAKIRALPNYRATPVIFVTSMSDFDSRAKSSVSGGNDFIAKPFLFMELNVKVLTYVFKNRLQPIVPPPQSAPAPVAAAPAPQPQPA